MLKWLPSEQKKLFGKKLYGWNYSVQCAPYTDSSINLHNILSLLLTGPICSFINMIERRIKGISHWNIARPIRMSHEVIPWLIDFLAPTCINYGSIIFWKDLRWKMPSGHQHFEIKTKFQILNMIKRSKKIPNVWISALFYSKKNI